MSGQGRLIINARGESAKAISVDKGVRVQCTAWADRVVTMPCETLKNYQTTHATVEVEFTKREAAALALQILDAAGYAAEAWLPGHERTVHRTSVALALVQKYAPEVLKSEQPAPGMPHQFEDKT